MTLATVVKWTNEIDVKLIGSRASDEMVMAAAKVSTEGSTVIAREQLEVKKGFIDFLMRNRHGSPFEHNSFTFFVKAPIFVFREFHRHRMWSYNEESGRYKQLEPLFYLPPRDRNLVQTGKPGEYKFEPGTDEQYEIVAECIQAANLCAYELYLDMLENGIAKEVARMCLPVNIFSSMYATANARSIMHFLSLRKKLDKREPSIISADNCQIEWSEGAMFPSNPMKEINIVADQIETFFKNAMPVTHECFVKNGYVAP